VFADKQQLGRTELMGAVEHVMTRTQAVLFVKVLREHGALKRNN
jgi:hypothetical protein